MMNSPTESRGVKGNDKGIVGVTQYAKLTIDELSLLIPRQEVRALESVQDVKTETKESFAKSIGVIEFQGEEKPVFCFTDDLSLTQVVPSKRQVCVVVYAKNIFYSVLCDRIDLLEGSQVKLHPVPDCMSTEDSPIHFFTTHNNGIACVVSSDSLYDLIELSSVSVAEHEEKLTETL